MATFDAIVVGLGAHGSAAALALSRRGLRVLGVEAGERGHELGSSGGRSRMIRRAYFEDPAYLPMLAAAWDGWAALSAARGEELIAVTGGLYAGRLDSAVFRGSVDSAREQGIPHEVLDAGEIGRRWPVFALESGYAGLFDPGAGMIRPEQAIAAQLDMAEAGGAELRFGERAVQWRPAPGGGGVEVESEAGVHRAGHLVIAAGAWTGGFVPDLALPLEVERMPVFWFEPTGDRAALGVDRLPVWIVDTDEGSFYGFPYEANLGLKVARHHSEDVVDPDSLDRDEQPRDVERVRSFMRRHMPVANGTLRGSTVCLYTNTPDLHFVIDTHPAVEGVAFASACSGHGFKFAPVVGEALADLALTGESSLPIERFGVGRFRRGAGDA